MELVKFFDKVEATPDFVGIGIDHTDKGTGVIVKYELTNMAVRLPTKAIEQAEWDVLGDIISGKREPGVLQHMTRVVGYYSKIENWNISKIGELHDRQKGDYEIK